MSLDLTDLKSLSIADLVATARDAGIDNAASMRRQELVFEILRHQTGVSNTARGKGVLEILPDGFGFLRAPDCNYLPGPDDMYVSPSQIRRFNLRTGDEVAGQVRAPKEGERYFALIRVETVNGRSPDEERNKILFDNLTPIHAEKRLALSEGTLGRSIDLLAPIGLGQRVLVLAPPRSGRTSVLHALARGARNDPSVITVAVLLDEQPEEITDFQRAFPTGVEVLSSTCDEPPARHAQVADMALERARRMVEQGRDVLLLLDSLSRLSRAYHASLTTTARPVLGVADAGALARVRRFFGAGRHLEEGGSLTVVTTAMVDSGSELDQVLLEEIRPAASAEIVLRSRAHSWRDTALVEVAGTWSAASSFLLEADERDARRRLLDALGNDPEKLAHQLAQHGSNDALLAGFPTELAAHGV